MQNNIDSSTFYVKNKPLDLKLLLQQYVLSYWYLYMLGICLGVALAWVYLRYTTPKYISNTTILIKDEGGQSMGASPEALFQGLGISQNVKNLANEIQILKSRTLIERVTSELNLNISYIQIARVKELDLYTKSPIELVTVNDSLIGTKFLIIPIDDREFILEKNDSQKQYLYGQKIPLSGDTIVIRRKLEFDHNWPIRVSIKAVDDVAMNYASQLRVEEVKRWSSVLKISIKDEVPERAKDILNTLVSLYNQESRKDKNSISANTLEFIEERLLLIGEELEEVERKVENYRLKNNILDVGGKSDFSYASKLDELDSELTKTYVEHEILTYIKDYFTKNKGSYNLVPANLTITDPSISLHIQEYNAAILERKKLLSFATGDNPILSQINEKIAALEEVIPLALSRLEVGVKEKTSALQKEVQEYKSLLYSIPKKERELLEITRQQRIKENLYVYLLEKREETALALAIVTDNARLIDEAKTPQSPISPSRAVIYLLGLILGGGIPILYLILRDILIDEITKEEDVIEKTQTPLLGRISKNTTGNLIVLGDSVRSGIAEMFRLLRTNLSFLDTNNNKKVILVTSGEAGDGKTFITLNLAMGMAISGKKTLAIGLDLRKPKLASYMDEIDIDNGVTSYLAGGKSLDEIVKKSDLHTNLHYITSGPIPPNPAELLMTQKLDQLFSELKDRFDVILLDTPPVGLVTDALLLNKHVDTSLFVIRMDKTKKAVLDIVDDIYIEKKMNSLGIVLNSINVKNGYGYGYGYGYYE